MGEGWGEGEWIREDAPTTEERPERSSCWEEWGRFMLVVNRNTKFKSALPDPIGARFIYLSPGRGEEPIVAYQEASREVSCLLLRSSTAGSSDHHGGSHSTSRLWGSSPLSSSSHPLRPSHRSPHGMDSFAHGFRLITEQFTLSIVCPRF